MFESLSLKGKILSGFLVVCLGLGVVAATGYYGLSNVVATYDKLATISVPNLGHISGMRTRGRQIHAESVKLVLYLDNIEETKKALESLKHGVTRYEAITQEYLSAPFSPGEKEVFQEIDAKYSLVKASVEKLLALHASADDMKAQKLRSILLQFEEEVRNHQASLLKLDDFHVDLGEKWSGESKNLSHKMNLTLIIVAFFTFILGIGIAFLQSRNISSILQKVAEKLQSSAESVSDSSMVVAEASRGLADGTNEQASSLQETVSSTNEIAAMTEKATSNSEESLKKAELSKAASEEGQESLVSMNQAIKEISESNKYINTQIKKGNLEIKEIAKLIVDIEQKTKLIDDIVFQTKLLSFNVSVEAARVGEHGKGFSVVAQEMSKLAEMSGKASKEISTMLSQTTQKALNVVEENEKNIDRLLKISEEKISGGETVVINCSKVLKSIIHYTDEMFTMIKETSISTKEQEKGIAEINKAITLIDQVTTQNAEASEQCSEAAAILKTEVGETRKVVQELLNVIYGKSKDLAVVHSLERNEVKSKGEAA